VFTAVATMPPDLWQLWRARCYLESDVDLLLADPVRSIVISTYSGCGITTSLAMLHAAKLLVFPYNPDQWPGQPQAFTGDESHFGQWMAHFADAVIEQLGARPEQLSHLSAYQHQFLLWLLGRYLGRRQKIVWQSQLESLLPSQAWEALAAIIANEPIDYGDSVADLKYQIHECVAVARCLGWEGIFASIDVGWWDWFDRTPESRARLEAQVRTLLTTLAPLEVPHFGVKLGMAVRILPPQEVDRLTRSRIKPMIYPATYRWSLDQLQQICRHMLMLAGEELGLALAVPPPELWQLLESDINSIWTRPCPATAHALASVWLNLAEQRLVGDSLIHELRSGLYRHAAPLRRDPRPGSQVVYRGQSALHLDDMPFRVFNMLWQHRGNPASNDALLSVAGTKANLDKLISRLREQIEPLYRSGTMIYLQRRQSSGTWLDADMAVFS